MPIATTCPARVPEAGQHVRHHRSLLAESEKRLLYWIAVRLPDWINSDHLSVLGLVSMLGVGMAFWAAGAAPAIALPMVVVFLALNWAGDSLDGTVARVRYILENKRVFLLKEELNTKPKFFYFYGV